MTLATLSRAGWIVSAAFFAVVLSSLFHADYVGLFPKLFLVALACVAAVRPDLGLALVCVIAPIAWYTASQFANSRVGWAETVACATLAGLSVDAARRGPVRGLPRALTAPVALFMTLALTSMIASLGVLRLRLGAGFTDALASHLALEHFIDVRGFPAVHAGLLLVEGTLLYYLGLRVAAVSAPGALLRRVARGTVAGAAIAAAINFWYLLSTAAARDTFWPRLVELASTLRWNAHYPDFNAAGSYFVMALLVALGLGITHARRRAWWRACAVAIAVALWLTGSRSACAAGVLAGGAALAFHHFTSARRLLTLTAVSIGALALVVVIAALLPQRGNQHSSLIAADIRIGLAQTSGRMIASRPWFGIGLGEFSQRSGEFSSPSLIEAFPVAIHENAHNNFLQIAAEMGVTGGLVFIWLVGAPLIAMWRRVRQTREILELMTLAALAGFVLTWLAGHPLLIPEASCVFWLLLGAGGGRAVASEEPPAQGRAWIVVALCAAIALTLPWRIQAMTADADFEHVCIECSAWQLSPDGVRSREAEGHATLFVPADVAFSFEVNPRTDHAVRLELTLDGRIADVVSLRPRQWNAVALAARTVHAASRFSRLDLRVVDEDRTVLWMTKVQPADRR